MKNELQYLVVLKDTHGPTEEFRTASESEARERIIKFVGRSKERKGELYNDEEPGSAWFDSKGWHVD